MKEKQNLPLSRLTRSFMKQNCQTSEYNAVDHCTDSSSSREEERLRRVDRERKKKKRKKMRTENGSQHEIEEEKLRGRKKRDGGKEIKN